MSKKGSVLLISLFAMAFLPYGSLAIPSPSPSLILFPGGTVSPAGFTLFTSGSSVQLPILIINEAPSTQTGTLVVDGKGTQVTVQGLGVLSEEIPLGLGLHNISLGQWQLQVQVNQTSTAVQASVNVQNSGNFFAIQNVGLGFHSANITFSTLPKGVEATIAPLYSNIPASSPWDNIQINPIVTYSNGVLYYYLPSGIPSGLYFASVEESIYSIKTGQSLGTVYGVLVLNYTATAGGTPLTGSQPSNPLFEGAYKGVNFAIAESNGYYLFYSNFSLTSSDRLLLTVNGSVGKYSITTYNNTASYPGISPAGTNTYYYSVSPAVPWAITGQSVEFALPVAKIGQINSFNFTVVSPSGVMSTGYLSVQQASSSSTSSTSTTSSTTSTSSSTSTTSSTTSTSSSTSSTPSSSTSTTSGNSSLILVIGAVIILVIVVALILFLRR